MFAILATFDTGETKEYGLLATRGTLHYAKKFIDEHIEGGKGAISYIICKQVAEAKTVAKYID